LSVATLERLEHAILNSLLDLHPNRDSAIDRLLDDVNNAETEIRPPAYPRLAASSLGCSLQRLRRIEELLVAAVMDGTAV
jgi:hypothetical protein